MRNRAATLAILERHATLVLHRDVADEREPESAAAVLVAHVGLEHARGDGGIEPRAAVAHLDPGLAVPAGRPQVGDPPPTAANGRRGRAATCRSGPAA